MSIVPSPPPNASATTRGLVSTGAQEFAGAKTLTGAILNGVTTIAEAVTSLVRAVGASLVLRSSLGAGASDVAVVVGSSVANASVNAGAKLLSVRTGIGGTEVESLGFFKDGSIKDSTGGTYIQVAGAALVGVSGVMNTQTISSGWKVSRAGFADFFIISNVGAVSVWGTDSSGTPGAATINKPSGKSAIASGATTVRITNSLVAAGDQVHITWHGDHGQTRSWVTTGAGFFDVNLNAAAAANTAFCWTVSKRL